MRLRERKQQRRLVCPRKLTRAIGCVFAFGWLIPSAAATESIDRFTPAVALPDDWVFLPGHSDEFSGPMIDLKKWWRSPPPWGRWSWHENLAYVSGGHLTILMTHEPHVRDGQSLAYAGGIVITREPGLLYGYCEARMKAAPRFPGVASAFWLFRNTNRYWTEIDVAEVMQRRRDRNIVDFSLYVMRGEIREPLPIRIHGKEQVTWDPSEDFHSYALLWTRDLIIHFLDDAQVGSHINTYWHSPMDLVLSVGLRAPLVDSVADTGFPTAMEVDYVRCWGPGDET